jgi:hypothetical protein
MDGNIDELKVKIQGNRNIDEPFSDAGIAVKKFNNDVGVEQIVTIHCDQSFRSLPEWLSLISS